MQADEIAGLKSRIRRARAKLLAAVDGLEEGAWDWRPGDGRWSVGLTLAHVGSAQWDHLHVVQCLLAGEPTAVQDFDLDRWNAASVGKRKDWSRAQILTDLEAAQEETIAVLNELNAGQLGVSGEHPALGAVTVVDVFKIIALHDGLHRRDVTRLLRDMDVR